MTGRALPKVAGDLTIEPVSRYTCLALELLLSAFAAGLPLTPSPDVRPTTRGRFTGRFRGAYSSSGKPFRA
jgi:hypothetical protein